MDQNIKKCNDINPYELSYERLEFLGDAVLDFIVNEQLFFENPDLDAGKLTQMKSAIVNNKSLSLIGKISKKYIKNMNDNCIFINFIFLKKLFSIIL